MSISQQIEFDLESHPSSTAPFFLTSKPLNNQVYRVHRLVEPNQHQFRGCICRSLLSLWGLLYMMSTGFRDFLIPSPLSFRKMYIVRPQIRCLFWPPPFWADIIYGSPLSLCWHARGVRPKDSGEAELVGSFPKEERGEEKNVTHCMTRSDWGYDGELCVDTAIPLRFTFLHIYPMSWVKVWVSSKYSMKILKIAFPFANVFSYTPS